MCTEPSSFSVHLCGRQHTLAYQVGCDHSQVVSEVGWLYSYAVRPAAA